MTLPKIISNCHETTGIAFYSAVRTIDELVHSIPKNEEITRLVLSRDVYQRLVDEVHGITANYKYKGMPVIIITSPVKATTVMIMTRNLSK